MNTSQHSINATADKTPPFSRFLERPSTLSNTWRRGVLQPSQIDCEQGVRAGVELLYPVHILQKAAISAVQTFVRIAQTTVQNIISHQEKMHPCGYSYVPIVCNCLMELLILQWMARAESKPHSHGTSINFTRVLSGQVLERKFHISGGEIRMISERIVRAGQWVWTLPFEIHELVALDKPAKTLHIYLPGRLSL